MMAGHFRGQVMLLGIDRVFGFYVLDWLRVRETVGQFVDSSWGGCEIVTDSTRGFNSLIVGNDHWETASHAP